MAIVLDIGLFHPDRHEIVAADGVVRLTPTESKLLEHLASRPDEVVTYAELLADVWGYHERVQSRTVFTTVARLRTKIERGPDARRQIVPVPTRGYRFVPSPTPPTAGLETHAVALRDIDDLPVRRFEAGETILREGDAGAEAYVLVAGTCGVHRANVGWLRTIGPGEVFGELAPLASRVRTASVQALTPVETRVITFEALHARMGTDTWVGGILTTLAKRLGEHEGWAPRR